MSVQWRRVLQFRAHSIPDRGRESDLGITTFNFDSSGHSAWITHDDHEDENNEGRHDSGHQRYRILSCHFDFRGLRRAFRWRDESKFGSKTVVEGEGREEMVQKFGVNVCVKPYRRLCRLAEELEVVARAKRRQLTAPKHDTNQRTETQRM